jgi:hypothetical protein
MAPVGVLIVGGLSDDVVRPETVCEFSVEPTLL